MVRCTVTAMMLGQAVEGLVVEVTQIGNRKGCKKRVVQPSFSQTEIRSKTVRSR